MSGLKNIEYFLICEKTSSICTTKNSIITKAGHTLGCRTHCSLSERNLFRVFVRLFKFCVFPKDVTGHTGRVHSCNF